MENTSSVKLASTGKRFAVALVDIILVPIILGVILGLLCYCAGASSAVAGVMPIVVNIAWLAFRDVVYSPGRAMVGIKLQKVDGSDVDFWTAVGRNFHIMLPIVLVIGYPVELIALLVTGHRLSDSWAGTVVVEK